MRTIETFTGAQAVEGGYYLNLREWTLEAVDGAHGTLPGDEATPNARIPLLALLVIAPLLGLAFVVLLPFLGLAVVTEQLWLKARALVMRRPGTARPATVPRR